MKIEDTEALGKQRAKPDEWMDKRLDRQMKRQVDNTTPPPASLP